MSDLSTLKSTFSTPHPSAEDLDQAGKILFPDDPMGTQARQKLVLGVHYLVRGLMNQYDHYAIPQIQLHPFTLDEILNYWINPTQFDLALKKRKGNPVLYGTIHSDIRRQFFNGLSPRHRILLFSQKMPLSRFANAIQDGFNWDLPVKIGGVEDIGMGRSVYKVTLKSKNNRRRTVVIKQEEKPNQPLFCKFLKQIGLPHFQSVHVEHQGAGWEISAFLGTRNLVHELIQTQTLPEHQLIQQLARHAAVGDVLGRGDRHLENYQWARRTVYPVDISRLCWEDNDQWSQKYVSGGLYEINCLLTLSSTPELLAEGLKVFFTHYETMIQKIKARQSEISDLLGTFLEETQSTASVSYFTSRLNADYIATQKRNYINAFFESVRRLQYKTLLENLFATNPEAVWADPWLKMYYLANRERLATFFSCKDLDFDIFERLGELAGQHKLTTPHDLRNFEAAVKKHQADVLTMLCT